MCWRGPVSRERCPLPAPARLGDRAGIGRRKALGRNEPARRVRQEPPRAPFGLVISSYALVPRSVAGRFTRRRAFLAAALAALARATLGLAAGTTRRRTGLVITVARLGLAGLRTGLL